MDTRHRRRSIGLRALLVVLAIQGMTPDARDISSRWLFQWFARSVVSVAPRTDADAPGRPGTSETPLGGEDRERTPDEVCTAPLSGRGRSRQKAPARPVLRIALALAECPRVARLPVAPASPRCALAPRVELIHAICRLTC